MKKVGKRIIFILSIAFLLSFALSGSVLLAQNITDKDRAFLEKIEKDTFRFFWEEANPKNGLIKDSSRPGAPCSIAATGFGLTAICIGEKRGWISYEEAYNRVLRTLMTFKDVVPNEHGFFYHFLDMNTGKRVWNCEVSTIDTALFCAGALFAGEYFKGTRIETLANQIYKRIDWPWLAKDNILSMGWKPETGPFPYYWDRYNELMILYALAIGSPTHPLPPESWHAWARPQGHYAGYELIYCTTGSLFVYQYSHAWIDFRDIDDQGVNWFENSINATKANRQFCTNNQDYFKTYQEDVWGLTACTGPYGYKGYGAKPGFPLHDGTICPHGAGSSIAFTPEISISALKHMHHNYGKKLYDKYGFKDSFNLDKNWFSAEHIGISQGALILMIENFRSGMIWKYFMKNEYIQRWKSLCFKGQKTDKKRQLVYNKK